MVRMTGDVVGVFLHEPGEAARLVATDSSDHIGHQFSDAPFVGRRYKGQVLGAPLGKAAVGDESVTEGAWIRSLIHDFLSERSVYLPVILGSRSSGSGSETVMLEKSGCAGLIR